MKRIKGSSKLIKYLKEMNLDFKASSYKTDESKNLQKHLKMIIKSRYMTDDNAIVIYSYVCKKVSQDIDTYAVQTSLVMGTNLAKSVAISTAIYNECKYIKGWIEKNFKLSCKVFDGLVMIELGGNDE